jgi:type IV pilus assembly protein PilC
MNHGMPRYKYKARNQSGNAVFGYADADDYVSLKEGLKEHGLWVTEVKVEKSLTQGKKRIEDQTVKPLELIMFCKQMAVMLHSGLPLVSALTNLADGASSRFHPVLFRIIEDIKNGKTYAESLALFPRIFSPFFIGMMEVGEAGGLLDDMHRKMARHLEQDLELKKKLVFAATYPALVLSVTIVGIIVILVYAFPKIADVYSKHQVQLPLITRIMIGISDFLVHFWYIPLIVVLGMMSAFVIFKIHQKPKIRQKIDRYSLQLPFYGEFFRRVILARFTVNLSLLLNSGIPILQSLNILRNLLGNSVIQGYLTELITAVQKGEGMASYLRQNVFFPSLLVSMARTGEESGQLVNMMQEAGSFFEEQVEDGVKRFVAIVEPVLIVFAAGAVFLVLVAFYLPLFKMFKILR